MTREEGIATVETFDGRCSEHYISSFCDYIGISTDAFWAQVHANINPDLFELAEDGIIRRRFQVGVGQ